MELRNLTTFLKIVETGSFSKAAEHLMYSQSTVTIQIQQLEEELHVKLFDRLGKKVFVTEKGQEVAEYAKQILQLTEKIAVIGNETEELQGTLTIASFDSLTFALLPPLLLEYHKRYPKVDIITKTSDSIAESKQMLAQNEVDLCFIFQEKEGVKDLLCAYSHEEQIVFCAPAQHPLVQKKNIPFTDILKEDFIVSDKHTAFYEVLKERAKNLRDYNIKPTFDIYMTTAAVELVKLGGGIILVPHYLIADAEKRGELCTLDVPEVNGSIWVQAVYHPNKIITPQMKALFDLLPEYYGK